MTSSALSSRIRLLVLSALVFALAIPAVADARAIQWSGYNWIVRNSNGLEGPGPNTFSDSTKNVWVDSKNKLHIRVHRDAYGRWTSSELFTEQWYGTGKYSWEIESPGGTLDRNVTMGMYVYQDATHEIDVELAKWGSTTDPTTGQYTVQPYDHVGNMLRFPAPSGVTKYSFDWRSTGVQFNGSLLTSWTNSWLYTGVDVTSGWYSAAHINLWQYEGRAPASGRDVEVVLRSFKYTPGA
jgi:hypothetical protein